MIAPTRTQRSYDHRLRAMVRDSGSVEIAVWYGIPKSTARGWLNQPNDREIVTLDVLEQDTIRLQQQGLALRRRVAKLTALLRLLLVVLRLSGFSFASTRLNESSSKRRLLRAIEDLRNYIPLQTILRHIGLSQARFHSWNGGRPCEFAGLSACPRTTPNQVTPDAVKTIREMVNSDRYRHVSTGVLARLAERLGHVFASPSTWYRLVRLHSWRRPRKRVYPVKPKVGIRATKANEIWHVDTTVIRLLDGSRVYLHAVIDNFSRRILAWSAASSFNPIVTASLLRMAVNEISEIRPTLLVDGGVENFNAEVDAVVDEGLLKRVLAQTDILSSNSMIESWWRVLKHQWLYLNSLDSVPTVTKLVEFYVDQHNTHFPHSAFMGQTPDEMYFGTGAEVTEKLKAARINALQQRKEANRARRCSACEPVVALGS